MQCKTEILSLFDDTPLNITDIPQERLDLANKTRSNIFPWRGQFSPELVELLLSSYTNADGLILDPFAGVGTTLLEAGRKNLPCLGTEINPAALVMAETMMFTHKSIGLRRAVLRTARRHLSDKLPEDLPLLSKEPFDFSPEEGLKELSRQHQRSHALNNIFSNTLIRFLASKDRRASSDAFRAFDQHAQLILNLPHTSADCRVEHCDARKVPLEPHTVSLVLTSPPYINVFNYHQNNRPSMELLGWNLLTVAKSEFGSNRKNRGNRFLTIVQYCLDMTAALLEMQRVLTHNGRAIIIVGRESNVRGVSFRNGAIVMGLASNCGFQIPFRQERKFKNKFGDVIYEDILHLTPGDGAIDVAPHLLAQNILDSAFRQAQTIDVKNDLIAAIAGAETVNASPLFEAKESLLE